MKKYTPKKSTQGNKIRFHFKAAEGKKIENQQIQGISSAFHSFFFEKKAWMAPSGLKLHAMIFSVGRLL